MTASGRLIDAEVTLSPDGRIGSPVATANPDHQPRIPTAGGVPPYCSCGWFPKDGELLANHLRGHDPTYGRSS